MRMTLLGSAAALALAFAAPALAQTPSNPLPANPSDVTNGTPAAGTPSGLPPGQDPSTTSHLTPSANAAPGSAPNGGSSSPAMGEGAAPADQGAAANPPSAQPNSTESADQSAPPPARHARKSHRMHSATASSDDSGHWAHEPGTGESGPASARASNIDSADTRSAIAPHLPAPQAGESATPVRYLRDADRALAKHRTGEAQQALEMAETRLLDRSTPASDANQTDQRPAIQQVTNARKALASGDIQGARQAIQMALADRGHADNSSMDESGASSGMSTSPSTMPAQAPAAPGGSGNAEAGKVIGSGTGGGPLGTPSQDSAGGAR